MTYYHGVVNTGEGEGLQRYASLVRPTEAFNTPPGYICLHGAPKDYYFVCGDEETESVSKPVAPEGWCVFDSIAPKAARWSCDD